MSSSQALAWNRRTCRPDSDGWPDWVRLAARGRTPREAYPEAESTDAGHRGGPARSSGEGPVMGLERRGRVVLVSLAVNRPRVGGAG